MSYGKLEFSNMSQEIYIVKQVTLNVKMNALGHQGQIKYISRNGKLVDYNAFKNGDQQE